MDTASRTIHKLHVKHQKPQSLARAKNMVEEGFRTASLPGLPPHGLTIIPRIDLGVLHRRMSPAHVSQRFDQAIRQSRIKRWVPGLSTCTPNDILWFGDRLEVYGYLMRVILEAPQELADIQHLATQVLNQSLPQHTERAVGVILRDAQKQSHAIIYVPRLLAMLHQAHCLQAWLQQLDMDDVIDLLSNYPLMPVKTHDSMGSLEDQTLVETVRQLPEYCRLMLQTSVELWEQTDVRRMWVMTLLSYHIQPSHPGVWFSLLLKLDPIKLQQILNGGVPSGATAEKPANDSVSSARTLGEQRAAEHRTSQATRDEAAQSDADTRQQHATLPQWLGEPSDHAGLPFLINVMHYLGFGKHLERTPAVDETQLGGMILWDLLAHLDLTQHDSIVSILPTVNPQSLDAMHFCHQKDWSVLFDLPSHQQPLWVYHERNWQQTILYDPVLHLIWGCHPEDETDIETRYQRHGIVHKGDCHLNDVQHAYRLAMLFGIARFVRQYSHLNLRQVVKRPGYVNVTDTHVDILYDLQHTDLNIRIGGLDINPGWVPWLRRVVQFHYVDFES